ncbi:hypothetical protein Pla108_02600 [Botrimarina colliarenosi]|uniref:Uncharacterized protein n=1 Tax=Botrimarina colliarenosi TaxID=2528001 RepID=A0A5C6AJH9_9BACT|nr:hypothetical protein [Botrimarina colliarenosi]TWT99325.1 hypothetical protein Pla108_02600 [Botrimarina colliarenosi]
MPNAPATLPSSAPALRVAECQHCGQLFAVYATDGEIACPACEAPSAVASLAIVELGVAAPVEVKVEEPTPTPEASPEPVPPLPVKLEAAAEEVEEIVVTADEPPTEPPATPEPSKAPTVAEWLSRSEHHSSEAAPRSAQPNQAEGRRSLSESLGWKPNSFAANVETPEVAALLTDEEVAAEPAENEQQGLDTLADFRFDFGSTALSEPTEETEGVSLELSNHDEAPAAEEPTPEPFRLESLTAPAPKCGRWRGLFSTAAGLLLVIVPAAYLVTTWPSDEAVAQLADPEGRLLANERPAEEASVEPPVTTQAAAEEPPAPFAPTEPIRDPATQPASFNKGTADEPEFDLPPSAPREVTPPAAETTTSPAAETPSEMPTETPADPFLAPAPAPSEPATQPQTTPQPAADRYAMASTPAPAEPSEFALPEDGANAMSEPPTPSTQVGLVNAPRYGATELAEAFDPAEAAARAFATGTLADPEQVSAMGQHYARLCYLAQVLTLLDTSDMSLMTAELQAADTFKRLLREQRARDESRQIAGPWIAWTGRPHGGVFFAGSPEDVSRAGQVIQYQFRIGDQAVPVVMEKPIDAERFLNSGATEVGVIGVVVENPREWIAGYEGDAQRVVWARKTVPLPRPSQP